ncbi:hypothetical protein EBR96_01945 [bacterium]|nr:hypothetical protein [bacterium]
MRYLWLGIFLLAPQLIWGDWDVSKSAYVRADYFNSLRLVGDVSGTAGWNETVKLNVDLNWRRDLETRELSVTYKPIPAVSLTTGRRIEKWGVADFLRGVDALNPVDLRDPGQYDLDDLRLPVWVTKVAYQADFTRVEVVAVHEYRPDKVDRNYNFLPYPNYNSGNYGLGLRMIQTLDALELELSYLDHYAIDRRHRAGAAVQYVWGNRTIKAEYAWDEAEIVTLGGLDWYLDDSNTLIAEFQKREDRLRLLPNMNSYLLMYRWTSDSDNLHFSWVVSENDYFGSYQRIQLAYDVSDAWSVAGGVLIYRNGKDVLGLPFTYSDLIFGKIRYSIF